MTQKRIVISQSMYFPWVGFLEQINLADVFVHYDDVSFSKGSFTNRVQVKTSAGQRWMTLPLRDLRLGQSIDTVQIDSRQNWRIQHREMLARSYAGAPYRDEMLAVADNVFAQQGSSLAEISRASTMALATYFGLVSDMTVVSSTRIGIAGKGSQRVLDIVLALGGTEYITGHGARQYLDHELFERNGVSIRYMRYRCAPYSQMHGSFTPYVTALDLIANHGIGGRTIIQSDTIGWKEFMGVQ